MKRKLWICVMSIVAFAAAIGASTPAQAATRASRDMCVGAGGICVIDNPQFACCTGLVCVVQNPHGTGGQCKTS